MRYINYEKVTTPEEAEKRIRLWLRDEGDALTITGLALYLGCNDKSEVYQLKRKEEFSDIIKKAILHCEKGYEDGLRSKNSVASIFALKNFNWVDSPAQQVNIGIASNGLPYQINDAQQQALQAARTQTLEAPEKIGQEYFE